MSNSLPAIKEGLILLDYLTYKTAARKRLSEATTKQTENLGMTPEAINGGLSPQEKALLKSLFQDQQYGLALKENHGTAQDLETLLKKISSGEVSIPTQGAGFSTASPRKITEGLIILDSLTYKEHSRERLSNDTQAETRKIGMIPDAIKVGSGLTEPVKTTLKNLIKIGALKDSSSDQDLEAILKNEAMIRSQLCKVDPQEECPAPAVAKFQIPQHLQAKIDKINAAQDRIGSYISDRFAFDTLNERLTDSPAEVDNICYELSSLLIDLTKLFLGRKPGRRAAAGYICRDVPEITKAAKERGPDAPYNDKDPFYYYFTLNISGPFNDASNFFHKTLRAKYAIFAEAIGNAKNEAEVTEAIGKIEPLISGFEIITKQKRAMSRSQAKEAAFNQQAYSTFRNVAADHLAIKRRIEARFNTLIEHAQQPQTDKAQVYFEIANLNEDLSVFITGIKPTGENDLKAKYNSGQNIAPALIQANLLIIIKALANKFYQSSGWLSKVPQAKKTSQLKAIKKEVSEFSVKVLEIVTRERKMPPPFVAELEARLGTKEFNKKQKTIKPLLAALRDNKELFKDFLKPANKLAVIETLLVAIEDQDAAKLTEPDKILEFLKDKSEDAYKKVAEEIKDKFFLVSWPSKTEEIKNFHEVFISLLKRFYAVRDFAKSQSPILMYYTVDGQDIEKAVIEVAKKKFAELLKAEAQPAAPQKCEENKPCKISPEDLQDLEAEPAAPNSAPAVKTTLITPIAGKNWTGILNPLLDEKSEKTVIIFTATTCPHCLKAIKEGAYEKFAKANPDLKIYWRHIPSKKSNRGISPTEIADVIVMKRLRLTTFPSILTFRNKAQKLMTLNDKNQLIEAK